MAELGSGQSLLSQVLSYLALSSSYTPVLCSSLILLPFHPFPLSHIQQARPYDHPLPLLSAVQSLLTDLSLVGKGERKQLSAALSGGEKLSCDSWLVNCTPMPNPEVEGWKQRETAQWTLRTDQCLNTELTTNGFSVSSWREQCHEIAYVGSLSGSRGLRFEWP